MSNQNENMTPNLMRLEIGSKAGDRIVIIFRDPPLADAAPVVPAKQIDQSPLTWIF